MKRLFVAMAALCLCACAAVPTPPPSPAAIADTTTLDEQAANGVELAYKGARTLIEPLVDIGVIRGATAERFRILNRKAFDAVKAVRLAYETGNAKSYAAAAALASTAIADLLSLANSE